MSKRYTIELSDLPAKVLEKICALTDTTPEKYLSEVVVGILVGDLDNHLDDMLGVSGTDLENAAV